MGPYQTLISSIDTTLDSVTSIRKVYAFPTTRIEEYPAVVFFPDAFENRFDDSVSNHKTYRFRVYVVVGATQKTRTDTFNTVLPNAVDDVVEALDNAGDGGTIDGHRVWWLVSSGTWSMTENEKGIEATAEMILDIQMNTSVS